MMQNETTPHHAVLYTEFCRGGGGGGGGGKCTPGKGVIPFTQFLGGLGILLEDRVGSFLGEGNQ